MSKFSKESFLEACGGDAPIKVLVANRDTGAETVFVFEKPNVLIGQNSAADIRLRHPAVANRHLYLQLLDARLFGISLAGHTATAWNGRPEAAAWVNGHDSITFGPFRLTILEGVTEPGGPRGDPLVTSPNGVPPVCLEYRGDPSRPFRGVVNRPLSLMGSSPACKFRIHSDRVSSVHCSLVRTPHGVWAVDLGGRAGFRLNGTDGRVARLDEGDVFELGGIGFSVHYGTPAPPATEAPPAAAPLPLAQRAAEPVVVRSAPAEREVFERLIGPVLEQFAAFQNQTFQQFQELLGGVMQMFGTMFRDQQEFVREELRRFDRLSEEVAGLQRTLNSLPEAAEAPAPPAAEGAPEPAAPEATKPAAPAPVPKADPAAPVTEPDLHVWLQGRIAELQEQRTTLWTRLLGLLGRKSEPG